MAEKDELDKALERRERWLKHLHKKHGTDLLNEIPEEEYTEAMNASHRKEEPPLSDDR